MEFSPHRASLSGKLYRNWLVAVTLAATIWLSSPWAAAQGLTTQYGHKAAVDKGPRALGLVQISPKGKARFTPIVIMMDGKYYDAGSYKAAPVPMALDFGIMYEGFRTGVSQGIFTITQPGQLNHVWIAEGTWTPAGEKVPEKHKKYSAPVIADEDNNGPPVLHRRAEKSDSDSGSDSKDKDKQKDQQKPATPAPSTSTGAPASTPTPPATTTSNPPPATPSTAPTAPDTAKTPAPAEAAKTSAPASASASDEQIADPNRPRLRRGKPDPNEHHEPFTTFDVGAEAKPGATAAATGKPDIKGSAEAAPQVTIIPAISDVGGPDPRPYTYDVKPAEEAIYRNKMLELATAQLRAQSGAAAKNAAGTPKKASSAKSANKSADKVSKPVFDDVNLRIFDLSSSNEPVLVLSAKTHPADGGGTESSDEPKDITLIARTNLEGEMQKLFFSQTDSRHLDVSPRMELIDAVDVDGDGRGELLFRRTFDGGSAYAIYRVTADRLWPLFEGTP
jgi:hypothetical protein